MREIELCFKSIIGRAKSEVKVLILRNGIVFENAVTGFDVINCVSVRMMPKAWYFD